VITQRRHALLAAEPHRGIVRWDDSPAGFGNLNLFLLFICKVDVDASTVSGVPEMDRSLGSLEEGFGSQHPVYRHQCLASGGHPKGPVAQFFYPFGGILGAEHQVFLDASPS